MAGLQGLPFISTSEHLRVFPKWCDQRKVRSAGGHWQRGTADQRGPRCGRYRDSRRSGAMIKHHNCEDHVRNRGCVACYQDTVYPSPYGVTWWPRLNRASNRDKNLGGQQVVYYEDAHYDDFLASELAYSHW